MVEKAACYMFIDTGFGYFRYPSFIPYGSFMNARWEGLATRQARRFRIQPVRQRHQKVARRQFRLCGGVSLAEGGSVAIIILVKCCRWHGECASRGFQPGHFPGHGIAQAEEAPWQWGYQQPGKPSRWRKQMIGIGTVTCSASQVLSVLCRRANAGF